MHVLDLSTWGHANQSTFSILRHPIQFFATPCHEYVADGMSSPFAAGIPTSCLAPRRPLATLHCSFILLVAVVLHRCGYLFMEANLSAPCYCGCCCPQFSFPSFSPGVFRGDSAITCHAHTPLHHELCTHEDCCHCRDREVSGLLGLGKPVT